MNLPHFRTLSFLLLVAASAGAQEPDIPKEVAALQATMHRIIDAAEPSIACIAVSRSERYKDFMRRRGVVAYWRERGWPELCRPVDGDDFGCD